jgi:hypothetical protein
MKIFMLYLFLVESGILDVSSILASGNPSAHDVAHFWIEAGWASREQHANEDYIECCHQLVNLVSTYLE